MRYLSAAFKAAVAGVTYDKESAATLQALLAKRDECEADQRRRSRDDDKRGGGGRFHGMDGSCAVRLGSFCFVCTRLCITLSRDVLQVQASTLVRRFLFIRFFFSSPLCNVSRPQRWTTPRHNRTTSTTRSCGGMATS
jgi:hypothetical protein